MLPYLWLIPVLPLAGFLLVGGLGITGKLSDRGAHRIAIAASALAFLVALSCVVDFSGGVAKYASAPPSSGIRATVQTAEQAERFALTVASWMPFGDTILRGWSPDHAKHAVLNVDWTFAIDALTCVMLLVVTGIGTLIHVYSTGYMQGERGYFRFFCYLNLFMSMMLTLVLAGNFAVMFVGWEGVGLCSYLLIGFYYDRVFDRESGMTCSDAGRKAFLTNRVGDFGFMLGVLLLMVTFGTLDFADIAAKINSSSAFWYGSGLLAGIGVLLFVGATGKSAQIPLYVWLPDAMAGPTPVSALIHAATMVTAGVYMLARMSALYWHAPAAMMVVAVVGCATAVFAGTMGTAQYDIKKVLAYSTVSQLGYMFLGVGVGAYGAAVFHLVTHAFFKACLFLGAGAVIARAGHSNDMRHYGGLRKFMPITAATFLVSTLAISGFPLLSGFMSKDEILAKALFSTRGSVWLWAFGTLGAVMTSFYMFRALYMTFYGSNRTPDELKGHLGESPRAMTVVLQVLAAGAVLVGFLGVPEGVTKLVGAGDYNWFAHKLAPVVMARGIVAGGGHAGGEEHGTAAEHMTIAGHAAAPEAHGGAPLAAAADGSVLREGLRRHPSAGEEWGLFVLAGVVFLGGLAVARWSYGNDGRKAEELAPKLSYVRRLLHRKWFVDEVYGLVFLRPFAATCRLFSGVDRWAVDGAVNGTARTTLVLSWVQSAFDKWVVDLAVNAAGWFVKMGGWTLRRLQTGYVQSYAAVLVVGTFVLLAAYVLLAR